MQLHSAGNTLQAVLTWPARKRIGMTTLAGLLFGAALSAWDIATTVLLGLTLDPFYIALIFFRGIILGSTFADSSPELEVGVIVHLIGASTTGFLAGILLPVAQQRASAVVGGAVATLPLFIGAAIVLEGAWANWHAATVLSVGLMSLAVGGANGYLIWEDHDLDPRRFKRSTPRQSRLFRNWGSAKGGGDQTNG